MLKAISSENFCPVENEKGPKMVVLGKKGCKA